MQKYDVPSIRRVWSYQKGNQHPYIKEEQTTQWLKKKVQKGKKRSTKHTHKTKDRVTRTLLKPMGEIRCSGRVSSSCSSSGTRRVNCKTPNVVYLLDCHVCGSQYVGESVHPFNKRMNGHRSDLTKKTLLPVIQHFVSPGHSLDDFDRSKIVIIDHNLSWKENQRQKRESFLIRELQTLYPEGINKKA